MLACVDGECVGDEGAAEGPVAYDGNSDYYYPNDYYYTVPAPAPEIEQEGGAAKAPPGLYGVYGVYGGN